MPQKNSAFKLGTIVIFGSVWGLAEAALGMSLKSCAQLASGSIMTGVALFFIAATWTRTRDILGPALLVLVASLFKLFDALLLGLPVKNGAVANPIFAFAMEGLAFLVFIAFVKESSKQKAAGQAFIGASSALLAVNLFPLVKFATGIPACVFPGSTTPLSLYYAPLAVAVSLVTVPLGFWAGAWTETLEHTVSAARKAAALRILVPSLATALCLVIQALIRLA